MNVWLTMEESIAKHSCCVNGGDDPVVMAAVAGDETESQSVCVTRGSADLSVTSRRDLMVRTGYNYINSDRE